MAILVGTCLLYLRLRIAAEAAGALSYLHSAASIPIVHKNVKSANILLDKDYTAKVSEFEASRFVPRDQVALATMVQGKMGEKALSFARSEEKANLAIYFLSCLKENCLFEALQVGILNEDNKQEIIEVANITAKCLSLKGEERPYMKEVAVKLEGIREMSQQQWVNNADNNFEETQSPERHDSIANDEEALLSLAYGR
ncbi:Wall-associated receptor kinase [Arachis hypogaea]|nr:Wall-associated receptor kinase [Arachis hypogaea]